MSDWSSDVCSSDLLQGLQGGALSRDIGVNQGAKALLGRVDQVVNEALLQGDRARLRRDRRRDRVHQRLQGAEVGNRRTVVRGSRVVGGEEAREDRNGRLQGRTGDRKSVVWGKSVSVRVDLGGRRFIKKKK